MTRTFQCSHRECQQAPVRSVTITFQAGPPTRLVVCAEHAAALLRAHPGALVTTLPPAPV